MTTKLDRLLESIDPARTLDQVSARMDIALNSFKFNSGTIKDWGTFKAVLTRFFRHTENTILRMKSFQSPYPDIDWGRCVMVLLNIYGRNGEKAAFEMVRTGAQGGLYTVLKKIAKQMAKEYTGNEISARISHFWHSLSVKEQLAATDEYLEKYGHLLPEEITEGSAVRIKANFINVLEEHPRIVRRMRNVGRI